MARTSFFSTSMRYAGLVIGCIATGMAYSMDAFNVYSDAIKDLFQYKQSQVELLISMANVGLLSSLPAGLLIPLFGFRVLSFIGLIITVGSYTLLCVAVNNVEYFSSNSILVAFFFFLIGVGGGIMYITATTVNVRNFDIRYLGIVCGLLHSVKSAILGVIMAIYSGLFAGTPIKLTLNTTNSEASITEDIDHREQYLEHANLTGFFAVLASINAVVNIFGIIFYGSYPDNSLPVIETIDIKHPPVRGKEPSESQHLISKEKRQRLDTEHNEHILSKSNCSIKAVRSTSLRFNRVSIQYSPLKLIKSYYYHAILWPTVFIIAFRNCYVNNITGFTTSMNSDQYAEAVLLSLVPILGTIVKPVIGIISDCLGDRVPRLAILHLFLVLEMFACILCATLFTEVSVITIGLVMAIFASCTVQTQSPAILVETFGKESFSYGWGFCTLAWSLSTFIFQMMYGQLYDAQVLPNRANYCFGQTCFTSYFAICASLALCIAIFVFYAVVKQFRELWEERRMYN